MLSFGERLRMARERSGLSQLDVYKAINLSNKSLSRYENNATSPDPDTVKALVELYDVSADFILGLTNEMGRARPSCGTSKSKPKVAEAISSGDEELIKNLEGLSPEAKGKAADYLKMLKTFEEVTSGEHVVDFKEKA